MHPDVACEWTLVVAPAQEPIGLDEAKLHASIHQDDENALTASYLQAAREAAQAYLNRALFTQTWKLQLSAFASVIWLPMAAPLQSVTTVEYYDAAGALQTLATTYYDVDTTSEPGRVVRKPNQTYPAVQSDRFRPVLITYVCGWADVALIPEQIKQGMRYYLASMDADRTGEQTTAVLHAAHTCWTLAGSVFWREPTCQY